MTRSVHLILSLAMKDWQLFFADKRGALLSFVVPIMLASAFGLIFARPAASTTALQLPLVVVVEDDGEFTKSVVTEFVGSPRVCADIVTRAQALRQLADHRPGVAVVFPSGFEQLKDWKPGSTADKPRIDVLYNPMCASEGQWAEGLVSECVMRKLARERLAPWTNTTELTMPFDVQAQEASESPSGFNSYTHSFSGMTLQYLLFWGMESGLLLLRDRQRSVWLRLRAAPVPLWCVLLAKAVSTATLAFVQILVTFGFGYLAFGVCITGSLIGFVLLAVVVSLLAAATGLLVAAVGGTETRARSICILVILGVSMLGGLWLPSFVLPGWARDLSLTLPTTWAMRGFDAMTWQGRGFLSAVPAIAVVAAFTALFLSIAVSRLLTSEARRRRGQS